MSPTGALAAINFFEADVEGGLGPFLATWLAGAAKWQPEQIGLVMTITGLVGLVFNAPAGALVDRIGRPRMLMALATALVVVGNAGAHPGRSASRGGIRLAVRSRRRGSPDPPSPDRPHAGPGRQAGVSVPAGAQSGVEPCRQRPCVGRHRVARGAGGRAGDVLRVRRHGGGQRAVAVDGAQGGFRSGEGPEAPSRPVRRRPCGRCCVTAGCCCSAWR